VGAVDPLAVAFLGHVWSWIQEVFGRIGDIAPYWLLLALTLKTAESALIGLSWRNILRAAYPSSEVSFKTAWGASQGGAAINALVPAQGGTAAMIGMLRASVRGSSVAGLASAAVVQTLFFTVASVLMVLGTAIIRRPTLSKGAPAGKVGAFLSAHPFVVVACVLLVIVLVRVVWPRVKPKVVDQWRRAKQGAAVFQDWRRYGREVALPSAASYVCRIGVNVLFMIAFAVPVTPFTVFLVASSHMLSGLFAITPGGVGQTQALDVATLSRVASTSTVAAFSVTQDSVLTIWNVVLGVAVMSWAFGIRQVKSLIWHRGKAVEEVSA